MNTRLTNLRSLMKKQKLDAVLITSVSNIIYITEYNGFSPLEREAYLLVTKEKAFLIVSALHIEEAKKEIKNVSVLERTANHPFKEIIKYLVKKSKIKICGFESESLTYAEYNFISPLFAKFQSTELSDLRLIKTSKEINAIIKACKLGDEAYSQILKKVRIGMTEKEISLELEWLIRKAGNDISFPPVVAFEEHAAVPHHNAGNRKLKNNNLVLLDFGVKAGNYCSDMTRVFFFGEATEEQKKVHETTVEAQQKAINYIEDMLAQKKNVISTTVDATAR
ncbi:MAG TPA: Xaa-Pro peptidase family protein, partial [Xanthomonadales bacterium]|nr:Xaa-Pro peptidase family protein [Xanthomonadales bacterium]